MSLNTYRGVDGNEIRSTSIVLTFELARPGAGRAIDEAFHNGRGIGSEEVLWNRHLESLIPSAPFCCQICLERVSRDAYVFRAFP